MGKKFSDTIAFFSYNPGGVFSGGGIEGASGGGSSSAPETPLPIPQAPQATEASDKSAETLKRKRAAMSRTVFTSPLGIGGQAGVVRKVLLGE